LIAERRLRLYDLITLQQKCILHFCPRFHPTLLPLGLFLSLLCVPSGRASQSQNASHDQVCQ
jgi:hypothetical protein